MSAHTPGPWFWQSSNSWRRLGNHDGDGNVMYPTKQSDGWPDVSFPNGGFDGPDARLIAAAPDLLAALQRAERCIRGYTESSKRECDLDGIRAAIAKATGSKT